MTSRPSIVRQVAHSIFRRLRPRVRRAIVRVLTPNYTVGAVVIVRDHEGAILLLRQPPGPGWSLPGGLLDRRESPADGAARELAEETGIVVPSAALTPANPNALVSASAQQVDVVFTLSLPAPRPTLTIDPVEVHEARWFDLGAMPPLTPPTARLLGAYGIGPRAAAESAAAGTGVSMAPATAEPTSAATTGAPPLSSTTATESADTAPASAAGSENGSSDDPEAAR